MEETDVLMQCGYCRNKSKLIIRASYVQELEDKYGEAYVTIWRILECRVCSTLNLGMVYFDPGYHKGDDEGETIVYPAPRYAPQKEKRSQSIPLQVNKAYDTALEVEDEPNAFAVLIGRTLETVCKHENGEGPHV